MTRLSWAPCLLVGALIVAACGGAAEDTDKGDGDASGDGDVVGDGDASGDGDVVGDGDAVGDGDSSGDGDAVDCTNVYVYGLDVRVVGGAAPRPESFVIPPGNGDAGERILPPSGGTGNVPDGCEATVVAVDGDYQETLMCSLAPDDSGDCICQGAGERPGTYEVTATLGGQVQSEIAEVSGGVCHVTPVSVIFFGPR